MNVICIEDEAFYALLDQVVTHFENRKCTADSKWVSCADAMKILGIKSKTTLQNLRDEGKIRFSQPEKKIIRYDLDSINDYLEKHAKSTF